VTLAGDGPVTYYVKITNTGQVPLSNVIVDDPVLTAKGCPGLPLTVSLPGGVLATNDSVTVTLCTIDVTCAETPLNNTITVSATPAPVTINSCLPVDVNGVPVRATHTCSARVECQAPVTCRVTGGGVLTPGIVDQSCIPVETTIIPFIVNGLTVRQITHGGQLGAPFSHMDCGDKLGNPCIRGEWQHTRHYEGKGNPRDVIDMNFHSANPKGAYDSLMCACLGCCDPETGAFILPTVGPLIHKFALCNPDDHKVCGPQPRPSPANAIIFSGIARVTSTDDSNANVRTAEYVVFRVYIEDRSEPGGFHPKGAVEPSDIYCFQAWKTGILVQKKPNYGNVATALRTAVAQANCDFLGELESDLTGNKIGSLPSPTVTFTVGGQQVTATADIQDCGPLDRGNHQIHPSTSATCTEPAP